MLKKNVYKICSWNIEGRLSPSLDDKRCNTLRIVNRIKEINADIVVLLEAHIEDSDEVPTSVKPLIDFGYKAYSVRYSEDKTPTDNPYVDKLSMMFLSKLTIKSFEIIKVGKSRNFYIVEVKLNDGKSLRIISVHLNDKLESNRLKQVKDLVKIINSSSLPTIAMGDYNAMHGDDLWPAKFLKTKLIRFVSKILLPGISIRAVGMATGSALKYIEDHTRLTDADQRHRPTTTPKVRGLEFLPSIRLIQIDHIYASKDITIDNFNITSDGGSDHRAITAEIRLRN